MNVYTPAHYENKYLNLGKKKWKSLILQLVENEKKKEIEF